MNRFKSVTKSSPTPLSVYFGVFSPDTSKSFVAACPKWTACWATRTGAAVPTPECTTPGRARMTEATGSATRTGSSREVRATSRGQTSPTTPPTTTTTTDRRPTGSGTTTTGASREEGGAARTRSTRGGSPTRRATGTRGTCTASTWGGSRSRPRQRILLTWGNARLSQSPSDVLLQFFKPIVPINVRLLQDHTGRASGEADVEFASHDDAMRAMSKDKGHMQHRYIELFLNSAGSDNGSSGYGNSGRRRM